jgi:hypothetical protein
MCFYLLRNDPCDELVENRKAFASLLFWRDFLEASSDKTLNFLEASSLLRFLNLDRSTSKGLKALKGSDQLAILTYAPTSNAETPIVPMTQYPRLQTQNLFEILVS